MLCTFAPTPSLLKRKKAVSAAPQIHFFCLLHCQTETDWGARVCTAKLHANLIFLSTSDLQLLNYVTFIQARLSQNWI